jgi:hypothetical protein
MDSYLQHLANLVAHWTREQNQEMLREHLGDFQATYEAASLTDRADVGKPGSKPTPAASDPAALQRQDHEVVYHDS